MNMGKNLVTACAVATIVAIAGTVRAEYAARTMQWTVQNAQYKETGENISYEAAFFYVTGTESDPTLLPGNPANDLSVMPMGTAYSTGTGLSVFKDEGGGIDFTADDYMFSVGLINSDGEIFATSFDTWTYASLKDKWIGDGYNMLDENPLTVTMFKAVPEPTSAMLLLFGLAGLSLRRRHA